MARDPSSWKDLFDLAADAVFLLNAQGIIEEANQEALRLTGWPANELLGQNIDVLFSPEERKRSPGRYDLLRQGERVRRSRLLTPRTGPAIPVEMNSNPLPGGSFQTIVRDMTEQTRAVEELRLSEEKFAKAFKTSPDAVTLNRTADGVYLDINEGFTAMTGYTAVDVVGRSSLPGDLGIWAHVEDRNAVVAELNANGVVRSYEAEFRKKDGGTVIGLFSARPLDIGGVPCLLAVTRDITEMRRTEAALRNAQKLEALGVLAGGIAHDFNNLLTAVFGYVESARLDLEPDHPARSQLEAAMGIFDRAKALSDQLLTFAKGGTPAKTAIALEGLVRQTCDYTFRGSNVRAELELQEGLWLCEADGRQLGQVLDNLLINARHAMPDGGAVRVSASNVGPLGLPRELKQGRYVKLVVADQGVGIDPQVLPRIFDPFFTTKESGNGLGLATVYSIVKRHGGHIATTSTPGAGATFTLYLPAAPE